MVWPGKNSGKAHPPIVIVLLVLLIHARPALKHGYHFYTDVAFRCSNNSCLYKASELSYMIDWIRLINGR